LLSSIAEGRFLPSICFTPHTPANTKEKEWILPVLTYSVQILTADSRSQSCNLVTTLRKGGLVHSLVMQLPGCLSLSVLLSTQNCGKNEIELLLIVFFTSLKAAVNATTSPMGDFILSSLLSRMSKQNQRLGLFSFPETTELIHDDIHPSKMRKQMSPTAPDC
jgi:hypothetical protein